MTSAGYAVSFSDGAPAAPAPPPGVQPWERDRPANSPFSSPAITDPVPYGRRMARILLPAGTDFRPNLH